MEQLHRYRFVASFITLLRVAPESPHRALTSFFKIQTGFDLMDAQQYEVLESPLPDAAQDLLEKFHNLFNEETLRNLR